MPLHACAAANADAKLSRSPALEPKQHVQQARGPAASPKKASFRAFRLSSAVRCGLIPAGCHCVAAMVRAMTDNKRMQRAARVDGVLSIASVRRCPCAGAGGVSYSQGMQLRDPACAVLYTNERHTSPREARCSFLASTAEASGL